MDNQLHELLLKIYEDYDTNPKLAIKEGNKLIREAERIKDYEALAQGHFMVGNALFACGERGNMLEHALHAVAYYQTTTDYRMLAKCQNLLGNAYGAEEEHQFSLAAYMDAKKTIQKGHLRNLGNYIENNRAAAYAELGDLEKAVSVLSKLYKKLSARKIKKDWDLMNIIMFNLIDYSVRLDRIDEAQNYMDEYEKIRGRGTLQTEKLIYLALRCRVAYAQNRLEEGNELADEIITCLEQGEENFENLPNYEMIALRQIKIGEYDRADKLADYLWENSEKTGLPADIIRACRVQAEYFTTIGEYKRAVHFYKIMDEQYAIKDTDAKKSQLKVLEKSESLNRNLEKLQKDIEKQKFLNDKDPLTQLLNRSSMGNVLERYMARAKEKQTTIGCIFIDVDFFKEYNDTYGHVKGDECLQKIAGVCLQAESEREHIHFARYGGDEFFGMLSGFTDDEVQEIAKEIARNVRKLGIIHSHPRVRGQVTVSIGVMNLSPDNVNSILDLITFSDKALYHSKGSGKDCIYMFDQRAFRETEEFEYNKIEYM